MEAWLVRQVKEWREGVEASRSRTAGDGGREQVEV